MADLRFFRKSDGLTLGEIAQHVGGVLPAGAASDLMITDIAPLETAAIGELSAFWDAQNASAFAVSHASVIVTHEKFSHFKHNGSMLMLVENPRLAFAQIGHLFYPGAPLKPGIHPAAVIDSDARIGADCEIHAGAVIEAGAIIGESCRIGANAVIGAGVEMGRDCVVGANCSISHALLGKQVRLGTNVSIGGEGFGFVPCDKGLQRICQLGRVIIEDKVEIGSNSAIDRGMMGDTRIGRGTVIDNLVQIGHNVQIGHCCAIAGQAGVAGSTTIGNFVMIGGGCSISDHLTIGDGARIAGKSGVMRNVAPKEVVAGYPAVPVRQWHRQTAQAAKAAARKPD